MDYEKPLQTECPVSGLLSLVLHVSRALGMAPLKFEKLDNGWRIRVSRIYSLCGQGMVIVFTIFSIMALMEDLKIELKTPLRSNSSAFPFVATSKVFMISVVVNVGAHIGLNRMRHLINCLSHLKQINKELSGYYQPSPPNDKKTWLMLTVIVSLVFVSSFLVLGSFIYFMFILRDYVPSFYIFYELQILELVLLVLQFFLISMCVVLALRQLNSCLNGLSQKICNKSQIIESSKPKSLTTKKIKERAYNNHKLINQIVQVNSKVVGTNIETTTNTPASLHRLALLYSSLCDIVRHLDDSHGCMLAVLPLTLMHQLIVTLYRVIPQLRSLKMSIFSKILLYESTIRRIGERRPECAVFSNFIFSQCIVYTSETSDMSTITCFVTCLTIVLNFVLLVLVIEPCHRTYEQMDQTKELVHEMMLCNSPDALAVTSDLNLFHRLFMMNQVNYSPMKLFTLNRSILITIIGSIATYLIVIINM